MRVCLWPELSAVAAGRRCLDPVRRGAAKPQMESLKLRMSSLQAAKWAVGDNCSQRISAPAGILFIVLALFVEGVHPARAQEAGPTIVSPTPGQALQGQVTITGTTGASNFASAELDFAYKGDATNTWFAVQSLTQPVTDGSLATWDTTKVTDGEYVLRLRVFATDGSYQDATVQFEIANYTSPAVEPSTAQPTNPPSVQLPTPLVIIASTTPEPTPLPTPTPLPPNPAALAPGLVYHRVGQGALIAVAVVLLFGAILFRRRS